MASPVKSITSQLDRVEQFLDQQNVRKAADTLETLKFTPDASGERLVALLQRTASIAIDCNVPEVALRMVRVLTTCRHTPFEVAVLYAKSGNILLIEKEVAIENKPEVIATLMAHSIDWIIARRGSNRLPTAHKPAIEAILQALVRYDAKDNAAAREILHSIGSSSPLMDWKLFLRGLMAWTEHDDERANENFRRLNPDRLPARLSAVVLNTTQMAKVIPAAGAMGQLVRNWRNAIAKRQSFTMHFKNFKKVMPNLPEQEKALLPRLAKCYYAEIENRGEHEDMKTYRDLFGPPPLDPNFDRLEAIVLGRLGRLAQAQDHWHKYEAWVAKACPWPKPINDMVRAIVRNNEGDLACSVVEEPEADLFEQMFRTLQNQRNPSLAAKTKVVLTEADAIRFWLESHRLAPTWNEPLLNLLAVAKTPALMDQIFPLCEEFLVRVPDEMELREHLAFRNYELKRFAVAIRHLNEAVARNPLDAELGKRYESTALVILVGKLGQQPVPAILEELQSFRTRKKQLTAPHFDMFQFTLETREYGRTDVVMPVILQLCEVYFRVVLSVLYKDKPAVKTKTKKAYNEAVESVTDSAQLLSTIRFHQLLNAADLKFTGQGILEKQLVALLGKLLLAETDIEAIEKIMDTILLAQLKGPPIKSMITAMVGKYPRNPIVQYVDFAYRLTYTKKALTYREKQKFNKLLDVCEASTEPRYQAKVPLLEALIEKHSLELDDGYGWYPS
jgi:tetratricopeptide (TPR) repeat protein